MMPTITRPTKVTRTSATLIDNVMVSRKLHAHYNSLILINDISDHFPSVVFLHNQKCVKREAKKIYTREINDTKISQIKNELNKVNWVEKLSDQNADNTFCSFHTKLVETIETVIPKKIKTISYKRMTRDPWLTISLLKCLKMQHTLYQQTLRSNKIEVAEKYKSYRKNLKKINQVL